MEALRGLGYSTAAALADVVDNSISAGAFEVRLRFDWDGFDSRISILDDGRGMNDPELEAAAATAGFRSGSMPLQRTSSGSLPVLSFHSSASGSGALRLVMLFQVGSLASSAFSAVMCCWSLGTSSSA